MGLVSTGRGAFRARTRAFARIAGLQTDLLEAKANIDFPFDGNDNPKQWVYPEKDPQYQMTDQARAALAAGRRVVWHAQTPKSFRELNVIAQDLGCGNRTVVHDPN